MASSSGVDREAVARVWHVMSSLVLDQDRRDAVRDALGMGFGRVKVLRRLATGPATLGEIAAAHAVDAPYATVIVDDLESRGWVVRTPHPTDRRRKLVEVTAAGAAAAERAEDILATPPRALVELDAADLAELDRVLGRVRGQRDSRPR